MILRQIDTQGEKIVRGCIAVHIGSVQTGEELKRLHLRAFFFHGADHVLRPVRPDQVRPDDRERRSGNDEQRSDHTFEPLLPPLSVRRRLKDILLCPARQIVFRDIIARKEFVDADAQRRAQLRIERHVRQTYPALPLGDRFIAHAELFGELLLREAERLSFARDVLSDPDEIHKTVLLCVDRFLYSRTAAKRTPPESRIVSFHGEMRRAAGVFFFTSR